MLDYHVKALSLEADAPNDAPNKVWLPGLLHLLRILDAGLGPHGSAVDRVRRRVDSILEITLEKGVLTDQKWSIDVSGAASEEFRLALFRRAFKGDSEWLRTAAYRQLGRVRELPEDIDEAVRRTLITMTRGGELQRERRLVNAQLRRLSQPKEFLRCLRLLLAMPTVDLALIFFAAIFAPIGEITAGMPSYLVLLSGLGLIILVHVGLYPLRAGPMFAWPSGTARGRILVLRALLSWQLYIMSRLTPLAFLIPPVLAKSVDWRHFSAWMFVYLYMLTWAPGAMVAARRGKILGMWWWPLYPGLFVHWGIRSLIAGYTVSFGGKSPKQVAVTLLRVTAFVLIGGMCYAAVFWLISFLSKWTWGWIVGVGYFIVLGILMLFGVATWAREKVSDQMLLMRWAKVTTITSAGELVGNLKRLSTNRGKIRYLLMLRRRQALPPNTTTINALTDTLK
jgi:hypothetical protein